MVALGVFLGALVDYRKVHVREAATRKIHFKIVLQVDVAFYSGVLIHVLETVALHDFFHDDVGHSAVKTFKHKVQSAQLAIEKSCVS